MRRRRSPARWLAPIALLACAFAVYTVLNATLLPSDDAASSRSKGPKPATTSNTRTVSERSKSSERRRSRRTYTVKPGDTLSSIAEKTGVSLERIQKLNPKLDSQSLQTGQQVKLSP